MMAPAHPATSPCARRARRPTIAPTPPPHTRSITKRYIAHDEDATASVGDYVRLEGCRPLSNT